VDSTEQDRMREYYWRKGIPSIVLAIVTLLLAGYSYWIVQPNIQDRYNRIVETNLNAFGLAGENTVTNAPLEVVSLSGETNEDRERRRQKLEETHLCLRRQIIWNNQDDLPRYRSGLVSAALAQWYLDEARRVALDPSETKDASIKIRDSISRSRGERQKGTEAMRAALKINGPFSTRASLWMIQSQLSEKADLSTEEMNNLEQTIRNLLMKTVSPESAIRTQDKYELEALLAQLLVRSALSPMSSLDNAARAMRLKEAVALLSPSNPKAMNSVTMVRWLAQAKLATESMEAKQLAWNGTQTFWADRGDAPLSVDTIAAVFECMLIGGSVKEAQGFLADQLPGIPSYEQVELRFRTAAACVRMLTAIAIHSEANKSIDTNKVQAVLSIAMQLQPESTELLALIESLAKDSSGKGLFENLSIAVEQDGEQGLKALLAVVKRELRGSHDQEGTTSDLSEERPNSILQEFGSVLKRQPHLGIVVSKLAIRQTAKRLENASGWIRVLNGVTAAAPEILVVWSDLANLYLSQSNYEQAIRCLEYLQSKLPDNQEIKDGIERAKSMMIKKAQE
jgi:tetratricopeptide (TPR) repeat protein